MYIYIIYVYTCSNIWISHTYTYIYVHFNCLICETFVCRRTLVCIYNVYMCPDESVYIHVYINVIYIYIYNIYICYVYINPYEEEFLYPVTE